MNNIFVNTRSSIKIIGSKTFYFDPLEIDGAPRDADMIFVPVGGKYTMDADEAAVFINQKPRGLVVPIHYGTPDACNRFINLLKSEVEVKVF